MLKLLVFMLNLNRPVRLFGLFKSACVGLSVTSQYQSVTKKTAGGLPADRGGGRIGRRG